MTAIDSLLERFDSDAPYHVDEALLVIPALLEVEADQLLDHVRDVDARK
jgi:hypothetical protein